MRPSARFLVMASLALAAPLALSAQNSPFVSYIPAPPPIPPEIESSGGVSKTQVDPAYATLYGGAGYDELVDHAVSGNVACMVGPTSSSDLTLFQPFQDGIAGIFDGWVACGDIATGVPYFSSYLGSDQNETITGADIRNDTLFVVGVTTSQTMPGTDATSYQEGTGGVQDCFVSRMSVFDGSGLKTTFFGLQGSEFCSDIAVGAGGVWITGTSDMLVDLVDPLQSELKGPSDALLARLSLDLSTLEFSTMLGGDAADGATALALAPMFGGPTTTKSEELETAPAYLVGTVGWSDGPGFPTSENANQLNHAGGNDAFLASFLYDALAGTVVHNYSTYVGSSGHEVAQAVDYDRGKAVLVGWTTSTGWNNTGRARNSGSSDGFIYVVKLYGETYTPIIAYAGPSLSYNLPLAIVTMALGIRVIAGYAIVPDHGTAFMQAL
ncbi:MAG TPA: hypothetical protein VIL33_01940, partial [Rhodothermia bacterium]